MKLKQLKIKNFRGYSNETVVNFDDFTAFVGKNDIGKSSVLEALDIFFNDGSGVVKIEKDDVNASLRADDNEIVISAVFDELPDRIVIDATNETTLSDEYLLNNDGYLEVVKKYPNGGKAKVFILANHPSNANCNDLLLLKSADLRRKLQDNNITCDNRNINAVMRKAIWSAFQDELNLEQQEIEVNKGETKAIWEQVAKYLPLFSLFQSDRENSDKDSEIQDPLQDAVKEILKDEEILQHLQTVADEVRRKLTDVSQRTLAKLREMDEDIADSLNPSIPATDSLKWKDVFKNVSITGDENIPINKRGSGTKRLILLNFFRAEVERRQQEDINHSVIYAIEEPETSQHSENQRMIIKALVELANQTNTQVIVTTHSPVIVKGLPYNQIRVIRNNDTGLKSIENTVQGLLPYPSLNEVSYLAFDEITEEYHNELYGYLEENGHFTNYKTGRPTVVYNKLRNGTIQTQNIIMTEYIRHQIHHPENTHNRRYTLAELEQSIGDMRAFIESLGIQ